MSGGGGIRTLGTQVRSTLSRVSSGYLKPLRHPSIGADGLITRRPDFFLNITKTTYSRRRSVSIAALSAGSETPSSLATWPHRIARRLDFWDTGHFEQASTSRSSFAGRCFAAHLWQVVRAENTRPCIVKTRPARNHAW